MTTNLFLFSFIVLFFFTNGFNSSNHQRIYCVIKTFGQNLATRALTIHQTWARRCDKHVFLTASNLTKAGNTSLPILTLYDVGDNYLELSIKVFDSLNILIQPPYDFDWLFITDDDTYVLMENLRKLLNETSEPLAFGHLFYSKTGAPPHLSGGAGYAINTIALRRMLPNLQTTCAQWYIPGMEDVYVSRCLQHLNVTLNGAMDGYQHRFYPLDLLTLYKMDVPDWYIDFNRFKLHSGFDCCSSETITFHYVTSEAMKLIEWIRYLHDNE